MHAVCDVPDRNRVLDSSRIEAGPHGARNLAMQRRHRIGAPRKLQPYYRHAELFVVIAGILASQGHQAFVRDAERFPQRPQVFFDQIRMKAVMAGRHRCMGREDHLAGDRGNGLIEADAFIRPCASESASSTAKPLWPSFM